MAGWSSTAPERVATGSAADIGPGEMGAGVLSSVHPVDRLAVAHDLWPRRLLERRAEQAPVLPQRVFWPENDDDVAQVVQAARIARYPVVPYGAGSGVCGGISPSTSTWVLDLKRMAQVRAIDTERLTCTVDAGVIGERLEEALNARGLTLGHFPSSLYCSTVGGWVATRGAGQLSSRYGKIEDMVLAVEGVDGHGRRVRAAVDDPATGPGAVQLLVGSEGALLVITRVTLRVHRAPSHRWLRGFSFAELDAALNAMRAMLQDGEAPSVLRLYDPIDTVLAGHGDAPDAAGPDLISPGGIARANLEDSGPRHSAEEPSIFEQLAARVEDLALFVRPRTTRVVVGQLLGRPSLVNAVLGRVATTARLIVGVEGGPDELAARAPRIRKHLAAHGGIDLGDEPGARWLLHRHRVSYKMTHAFAAGSWVDTMEVATGWESVAPLYHEVREALADVAVVMCHMSHAYRDGCSLYFTFAGFGAEGTGPRSALARYDLAWQRALTVVRRRGAAPSHHHGVGRSKRSALARKPGEVAMLEALKRALDPDDILNPGVLGLGMGTHLGEVP